MCDKYDLGLSERQYSSFDVQSSTELYLQKEMNKDMLIYETHWNAK